VDESLGDITFCFDCRRKLDTALASGYKDKLYIMVNQSVAAPNKRIPVLLCSKCRDTLKTLEVDGFEVFLKK